MALIFASTEGPLEVISDGGFIFQSTPPPQDVGAAEQLSSSEIIIHSRWDRIGYQERKKKHEIEEWDAKEFPICEKT